MTCATACLRAPELLVPDASKRAQLLAGDVRKSLRYFPERDRFDRRAARQCGDGAGAAEPWNIFSQVAHIARLKE